MQFFWWKFSPRKNWRAVDDSVNKWVKKKSSHRGYSGEIGDWMESGQYATIWVQRYRITETNIIVIDNCNLSEAVKEMKNEILLWSNCNLDASKQSYVCKSSLPIQRAAAGKDSTRSTFNVIFLISVRFLVPAQL